MTDDGTFTVRFWGVRGSVACSGPDTRRYGGNTSCVEVRCGARILAFDAGTGVRPFGLSLPTGGPLHLDHFYSHTHWDHIVGLPFFCPAYRADCEIAVHSGHLGPDGSIEAVLRQAMSAPLFPVPLDVFHAKVTFENFVAGETLDLGDRIVIRTAPLNHPNGATGYRIEYGGKSLAMVAPTGHVEGQDDPNVLRLMKDADLVIYDCTFTAAEFASRRESGNSTWNEGVRLCQLAGAKRMAMFHYSPYHDDDTITAMEKEAQAVWPGVFAAHDYMELEI